MRRKIQKLGKSTHAVSLPSKWVRGRGLKKGDLLELSVDGDRVMLGLGSRRNVILDITAYDDPSIIKNLLMSRYIEGYDTLAIRYRTKKQADTVKQAVGSLNGFEVASQDSISITVEDVAVTKPQLGKTIAKVHEMLLKMMKDFHISLESERYDVLLEIAERVETVYSLILLALREVNKNVSIADKRVYMRYLRSMEELARFSSEAIRAFHKKPDMKSEDFMRALSLNTRSLELFTGCSPSSKHDTSKSIRVLSNCYEAEGLLPESAVYGRLCTQSLRRMALFCLSLSA
jgi:phosphate uptake regulator